MFCILPCQHHLQRISVGFDNSSSWALNNHSTRVPRGSQCFLNNQRKPPVLNIFWIGLNWTWEIVLNWTWEIVYRKKIEMFAPVSASTHEHSCLSNHNCTTTIVYQPHFCEPLVNTLVFHYWTALVSDSVPTCRPTNQRWDRKRFTFEQRCGRVRIRLDKNRLQKIHSRRIMIGIKLQVILSVSSLLIIKNSWTKRYWPAFKISNY